MLFGQISELAKSNICFAQCRKRQIRNELRLSCISSRYFNMYHVNVQYERVFCKRDLSEVVRWRYHFWQNVIFSGMVNRQSILPHALYIPSIQERWQLGCWPNQMFKAGRHNFRICLVLTSLFCLIIRAGQWPSYRATWTGTFYIFYFLYLIRDKVHEFREQTYYRIGPTVVHVVIFLQLTRSRKILFSFSTKSRPDSAESTQFA